MNGEARPEALRAHRFDEDQVKTLVRYGREVRLAEGETLFNEGVRVDGFWVVLEGEVRVYRLDGAAEELIATHGPGDFTGQLATLAGRATIHRARAAAPSRLLEIDSEAFRTLAVEESEISDVFISKIGRAHV